MAILEFIALCIGIAIISSLYEYISLNVQRYMKQLISVKTLNMGFSPSCTNMSFEAYFRTIHSHITLEISVMLRWIKHFNIIYVFLN